MCACIPCAPVCLSVFDAWRNVRAQIRVSGQQLPGSWCPPCKQAMGFTMHSHSGQFCGHAKDQLEAIVQHAAAVGFTTMGLTEHMPRTAVSDLYPEEAGDDAAAALAALFPRHAAYLAEAQRLQRKYAGRIGLVIGFEAEWIRPAEYAPLVRELAAHPAVDYFVGSVHHAFEVPIDFDRAMYARAVAVAGGGAGEQEPEQALWERYYDDQFAMLDALRPRVIGHFDLIRLMSAQPDRDARAAWGGAVWARIVRNLRLARDYGGWLECNTAALRKGLADPYPARPIAEEWVRLGGRWTLSDDSHGIDHVATNYAGGVGFLRSLGVAEVWKLERDPAAGPGPKATLVETSVPLAGFLDGLKLD